MGNASNAPLRPRLRLGLPSRRDTRTHGRLRTAYQLSKDLILRQESGSGGTRADQGVCPTISAALPISGKPSLTGARRVGVGAGVAALHLAPPAALIQIGSGFLLGGIAGLDRSEERRVGK